MYAEILVLRMVHIVGGVFWVGSATLMTFFLMPALAKAGPSAAGVVMAGLQERRLATWLPVVALLTVLSGLRLLWIFSGGDAHWLLHPTGHMLVASGLLSIIAFVLGIAVSRPAMTRVATLSRTLPTDEAARAATQAEIRRLQQRAGRASVVGTLLLILTALGMSVARYL